MELSNYRTLERKDKETIEDQDIQSENQNLLIAADVIHVIKETEDRDISNSMEVLDCRKKEIQTAENQKSATKSSDYVNEEYDTNSEAQKLESQKKDPEKCVETKVVSESSVCSNLQMDNEDDPLVISGGPGHKESHGTGIL